MTKSPQQAAGLAEAQGFADEVTTTYRVYRVKIIVGGSSMGGWFTYYPQSGWIGVGLQDLEKSNVRLGLVMPLAWATLNFPTPTQRLWKDDPQQRFAVNHRAVEIGARFLGMAERHMIDRLGGSLVAQSKVYAANRIQAAKGHDPDVSARFYSVHPCDQLHDLWIHFAVADPEPACER